VRKAVEMKLPFDGGMNEECVIVQKKDSENLIVSVAVPQTEAVADLLIRDRRSAG
jgi:hypothetical protein